MSEAIQFKIGAEGVDATAVVEEIRAAVEQKMKNGAYTDACIARAERTNLLNLSNQDQFLGYYLNCLRDAVYVDISDFEIRERRRGLAPLLIKFKTTLWKMLKFYTYRLWSQQNQVNGLLVTGLEGLDEQTRTRIEKLEKRVEELEQALESKDPA